MDMFKFFSRFPTQKSVIDYIIHKVYNDEVICPFCGTKHKITRMSEKNFHCNNCNSSFSIFKGTIFEHSKTDMRKWLLGINEMLCDKKGISAIQFMKHIGVTYKTAWRMLQQIRTSMNEELIQKFSTIVEIDETYIGGKPRHSVSVDDITHEHNKRGRGTKKIPVVGIKERETGRVFAKVMLPNEEGKCLTSNQLYSLLEKSCEDNTMVMTDEFRGYNILDKENSKNFIRFMVNHSVGEFSAGNGIHTNGIEGFWANIKRAVYGTFHHISLKYMQRYIDEFCYRMNHLIEIDKHTSFNFLDNLVINSCPYTMRVHLYKNRKIL